MKTLEIYIKNKDDPVFVRIDDNGNLLYKPLPDLSWQPYPTFEEIIIKKKYRDKYWKIVKKTFTENQKVQKIREV